MTATLPRRLTRVAQSALMALCLILTLTFSSAAQEGGPDYEQWSRLAEAAEQAVAEDGASNTTLEDLRVDVAAWREAFQMAQQAPKIRIEALQDQLDALGSAPEEGLSEDAELAARRAELEADLETAQASLRRAEEAFTRANAIISRIDAVIRGRQADALFSLGPSPLNPAHWPGALEDLSGALRQSGAELRQRLASSTRRSAALQRLPAILMLTALGLILLARGQGWAQRAVDFLRSATRRGTGFWRFILSLGQIVLPLGGIWALTQAASTSGFFGPRWTLALDHLPQWAFVLLAIRWLADQSFNDDGRIATLRLEPRTRRRARGLMNLLAATYVLRDVIAVLSEQDNFAASSHVVIGFPVLALSGFLLFRLGRLRGVLPEKDDTPGEEDAPPFSHRLGRIMGRAAMVIGLAGPVMAAIGFGRFGDATVYPFIATLAVVGLVMVLQRVAGDVQALVTGDDRGTQKSLIPVLAGIVLSLLALPVLALIWGARVADLTEIWAQFTTGFMLGERRISPSDFLVVAVIFGAGYMATRLLQGALRSSVLPRTQLDGGAQNAVVSGLGYVGIVLSAVIAVTAGGLDLSSLAIVAGALSVGIGFGLQNIVSNFVSGIILLIERPIAEGDWIEVGGQHGTVKKVSVRSTRIETFDRFDVIVPNADLVSGQVRNYTHGNVLGRIIVPVGVAYGSDTRAVEKILMGIARDHPMVLMNPAPTVVFSGFGADSMDFEIRAVLRDITQGLSVRTEMNHQIAERFADAGLEIPFAQRDIWLRNPEALQSDPGPDSGG